MAQQAPVSSLRLRTASQRKAPMEFRTRTSYDTLQESSPEETDQIDPFTHSPPFTPCQKFVVFFNALWLAPIRFLFIVIPMVIAGTVGCVIALIGNSYDPDNPTPLGRWGRFIHNRVNPLFCRWFLFGFGFHWIRVKGSPAPSTEAPILVAAPHTSMLDIFVVVLFGVPSFVAREETRHTPFFGPIITRAVRPVYVSREDASSRSKSADEIQRRANTNGGWPHVLIYPEATTTNRRVLLKYKTGAFTPKVPVQPMLIKYNNKLDTTSWGGDGVGLLGTLFYTMCQFHNSLEVEFLPVYHPSQSELNNPRLYADNVQQLMSRKLNIPAGDQSIEDLALMKHARSLGLPFSSGMVVYYKTSKLTGLKVSEMKSLLTRFSAMDLNKDGFVEVGDLAAFLNVPVDACLQAVFDNCKKTSDGKVSFAGYLCGLIRESHQLLEKDQFMKSMFDFFDHDCDGQVSLHDITQTLPIQALPSSTKPNKDTTTPSNMTLDDFKSLLSTHPEYLVLFYECQTAGISCPPEDSGLHDDNETPRENSDSGTLPSQTNHVPFTNRSSTKTVPEFHTNSHIAGLIEVEA